MQALQPFRMMDLPPEMQLKIPTEAVTPWYIEIRYREEDLDGPHYETKVYAIPAFLSLLLVSRYFHNAVGPIIPTRFTGILNPPEGIDADESANASFEGAVECHNMISQWGSQIRKIINHYSFRHGNPFTDEAPGIGRLENVREVVFPNIKVADYNYRSILEFLQGTKLVNILSSDADEDKAIITILRHGVNWGSFVDIHAYPCQAMLEWAFCVDIRQV
ncbi:hypothetical protein LTR70_008949 [Exophiala xenobiotica]|uniref:Uncharacterized protein n=1 Tax=Lithohypha guttulata TaxID=1690604 RepID=A0ABR0K070_9EURO|nr:hypothetical protein LTR24_008685 [Lithohypha guttulata]KAK5311186.1 hypothetical protein LTR70_008949 [Exophiala xenobiotica]